MMFLLYNLTISIFIICIAPLYLFRSIFAPRTRPGLKEKFGFISKGKKNFLNSRLNIWLHAVSVGEILASLPLIEIIKRNCPEYQLVISTTTVTGQEIARKRISEAVFIYFPLDLSGVTSKVLDIIKPSVFIVAESEIWPNFFRQAYRRKIPIIIFNGRISSRSYNWYRKISKFFRQVLNYVSLFGMQTETDAQRIINLGGVASRVRVTGNAKFDALDQLDLKEVQRLGRELRISGNDLIFVSGSTHPGEEGIILSCFIKLLNEFTNLHLILCPRHLERLNEIENLIKKFGLSFSRRSRLNKDSPDISSKVLLLDTMGELAKIYSLATIVFVGGSLVPKGGQNMLEPVNFGKPVIFGPHTGNFQEITRIIKEAEIGFQVYNEKELYQKAVVLLKDEILRNKIKDKAELVINGHKGASRRNFDMIKDVLSLIDQDR